MLGPKKPKYRKQMKMARHLFGVETRGCTLEFGDYGLYALEEGWITDRQIEAARRAITRHVKRGGKVWIRIFPQKPISRKPAETRMGSGKGSPEYWVAEVRKGRILFEMAGTEVTKEAAKEAMMLAAAKLPISTKFAVRSQNLL